MNNLLFKNEITSLLAKLGVLYIILMLCRIVFYIINADTIGAITAEEFPSLLTGAFIFDSVSIFYVNCLFVLFTVLPVRIRYKRWYRKVLMWLYCVINTFVVIINFSDAIYFHFAKKRFTAEEFHFTDNDNTSTIIFKALGENWYWALVAILLIWLIVWSYRKLDNFSREYRLKKAIFYSFYGLLTLAAPVLMWGITRGGLSHAVRPITLSNATQYTTDSNKAQLILSNPFCIIRTHSAKPFQAKKYFSAEELESLYTPDHYPTDSMKSIGRKNIVIFTLESFSREHSALLNPELYEPNERVIPFLDSLMTESLTFTDAFANGRKSIDALPSIIASIPSFERPFVLRNQSVAPIKGLPAMLNDMGYTTAFFSGAQRNSMGFVAFAKNAGMQQHYTREEFEEKKGRIEFDGYWGIWDEPFMLYMCEELSNFKEPFFADIFTLSSHHPFVVPKEYEYLPAGRTKIHRPASYTDLSLRRFFELAAKQPWYKNTIFVFCSDHVSSETFAPKTKTVTGNTQILMAIYTPDGSLPKGYDSLPAQQADIMPTLLGLVGNKEPFMAFGNDLVNGNRPRVAISSDGELYQIISDSLVLFYDSRTEKISSVYTRQDTLQKNNVYVADDPAQLNLEKYLKAVIQSYGERIEQRNYLPKR